MLSCFLLTFEKDEYYDIAFIWKFSNCYLLRQKMLPKSCHMFLINKTQFFIKSAKLQGKLFKQVLLQICYLMELPDELKIFSKPQKFIKSVKWQEKVI